MNSDYYNKNAKCFYNCTVDVDMSELYAPFLEHIPDGGHILDAGCGSGRDAKAFAKKGYKVTSFDASEELVKMARELTGLPVEIRGFEDVHEVEAYDGIWAGASLLHLRWEQRDAGCEIRDTGESDLVSAFAQLARALKPGGVFYCSFKYGDTEWTKDGRTFTDMNEERMQCLVDELNQTEPSPEPNPEPGPPLHIERMWVTDDMRPDREDKWLNCILLKNGF